MSITNYKGAIHDLILELFMVKDGYTVGQKLEHLKKVLPTKRYYDASDEQIYSTLEKTIKNPDYYKDEFDAN
jgi:hypothetical protein